MRPQLVSPLQFLTQPQVESVHQTILAVLGNPGVRVEWRPALELYAAAGCRVDFERQNVQIPEAVLERSLKSAPASFHLYGATPAEEICVTPTRCSENRSFGHTSTQSPQAVHLAESTTGRPTGLMTMASNTG